MVPHDESSPNRREFARTLAVMVAAPVVAQVSAPEAPAQPVGDPLAVAAEALTDIARARYGKDLTTEQVKAIKTSIYRRQSAANLLKKVKLQNGDEPSFVFRADLP
ncbi:MAG: hypothetical protein K2R98_13330 [Gemmataceae bacterium]|nr:hypothetical protein [Gemmataceae bacterium]